MNLVIDFGNTLIKAALFSDNRLHEVWQGISMDDLVRLKKENKPDAVIVSSVSREKEEITRELGEDILFLTHETPMPFVNRYDTPETLGLDRMAAVAGTMELFPEENCLAVDMGTCITFDLINKAGEYLGGGISPGLMMRFRAIHHFTARLPEVKITTSPQLIGKSTVSCIQSGVMNGIRTELDGIMEEYASKYDHLRIILCGGDMNYFENTLKQTIFAAPELVLRGLNRILRHNA